jgi:hypothetical protein
MDINTSMSEYSRLVAKLDGKDKNQSDVYEELVKLENNVLNVAERISANNLNAYLKDTLFYNQSLIDIFVKSATTWKAMFVEIFVFKDFNSVQDIMRIFLYNDRKIYLGILLGLVSLFLFFIDISS